MKTTEQDIQLTECGKCGIIFGYPKAFDEQRRDDGYRFYCPNGHDLRYADSLATKNRKLKSEQQHWEQEASRLLTECDSLREQVIRLRKAWWFRLVPRFLRRRKTGIT
jgi:hypothetical protein